jgi:ethanolamine ammonia-lyase small subunit
MNAKPPSGPPMELPREQSRELPQEPFDALTLEPSKPQPTDAAPAPLVTPARWHALRQYTDARIALGRAGHSLPTAPHLAFQLAHAQARDAVHVPLDALGVVASLRALGQQTLLLHSAAADRTSYLQRPDLGRRLDELSRAALIEWRAQLMRQGREVPRGQRQLPSTGDDGTPQQPRFDIAFVIADGLSALAVHTSAVALVAATLARLRTDPHQGWTVAPIAVVEQGRVAVGDEVGQALLANAVVVVLGERPGLSSPDSLGLYLSWAPKPGLQDASRNCISNVRPAGLPVQAAAAKLHYLLTASRLRQLSGVGLKDDSDDLSPLLSK